MSDHVLFHSDLVTIGRHRMSRAEFPSDPPEGAQANLIVFPLSTQQITSRRTSEAVVTDRNGVLLYNRGESYPIHHIDDIDRCDFLGFGDESAIELAGPVDAEVTSGRPFNRFYAAATDALYWQARRLFDGATSMSPLQLEEAAMTLARTAVSAATREQRPPEGVRRHHRRLAEDTKELLATTDSHSSISSIARSVGASPAHLSRVFRRVTGTTMHRYRSSLRLRESVDDLSSNDLSMVAASHGFASHSHYTSAFRRAFDRTPSEARLELTG